MFHDRGGPLSGKLYGRRDGSVGKLVFRRSISVVQVASGRSGHLESMSAVLREKRENGVLSAEIETAEEKV